MNGQPDGCADFLRDDDIAAWDDYVLAHRDGTVFHQPAWSLAVQKTYRHAPLHLAAKKSDGSLAGVLPLFLVKSIFEGKILVSIPYATYGGILADDEDTERLLFEKAREISVEHGAAYLELRNVSPSHLDLPVIARYDTFIKSLPADPDDVLKGLPKKARAATRNGLKILQPRIGDELMDDVYDLYAYTLRRLGSPNYSRSLWRELKNNYGKNCVTLGVFEGDKMLAGVVSFIFRDTMVAYFSGSLPRGMKLGANNVMYVSLMEYAVKQGLRQFDFNRTRRNNSGPYAFKRHMGFEPSQLHYQIALNRSTTLPNLSPGNSGFSLAIKIWRHMPLFATRIAGGIVTRWIP